MGRRRGKRLLIWTGVLLGIVIVGLALLPVWLPWVLAPIAHHYGFFWQSYQRVGYSRFTLGEVSFTNRHIRVRAQRVELPLPTAWVLGLASDRAAQPFVAAANWELAIQPKQ